MKSNALILVPASVIALLASCAVTLAGTQNPQTEPLVQKPDLVYQGSFALPQGTTNQTSFAYGGYGIAYDPADNSLFLTGHSWYQYTSEISIPTPVSSNSINALPIASEIQPLTNALQGTLNSIDPSVTGQKDIGGYLVYNNRLVISAYVFYDASGTQTVSHFTRPISLSNTSGLSGPFRVGTQYPGFVSGYMTLIPQEWQTLLGGPALTGNCCLNIVSVQSNGPAVSVFNPNQLGTDNPVPATPLVGYPLSDALGAWGSQSDLFNGTTQVTGVAFPNGTRSVLFFGRQGIGPFCYGPGTSNQSLAGTPSDANGDNWCYDPTNSAKGGHAYPYVYQVWAYDANDLLKVARGNEAQYDVKPYATWSLSLPFTTPSTQIAILGAAYNPNTNQIYVSQSCIAPGCTPIIDVLKLSLPGTSATSPAPTTPSSPANVTVN